MTDKHVCQYSFKWRAYSNPVSSPIYHLSNKVADALSRLETEPTTESIAEAKNFVNIREANAMLCGVEKHIADATQGVEKRLAKHGMAKRQVFVPDLAC